MSDTPMGKEEVIKQLNIMKNKGCCIHTQQQYISAWNKVRKFLTISESHHISVEHNHYIQCGEGSPAADGFYRWVNHAITRLENIEIGPGEY